MCIINITFIMTPRVSPVLIPVFKILKLKPKKLITLSRLYTLTEAEPGFECKMDAPKLGTLLLSFSERFVRSPLCKVQRSCALPYRSWKRLYKGDEFELLKNELEFSCQRKRSAIYGHGRTWKFRNVLCMKSGIHGREQRGIKPVSRVEPVQEVWPVKTLGFIL